MDRATFIARLEKIKAAILKLDAEIFRWEIGEPVSMETVHMIEEKYQIKFPADVVDIVTQVAGKVNIEWNIQNDDLKFWFPHIFGGALRWDIERYLSEGAYRSYQYYTTYFGTLRGMLYMAEVPNGDGIFFNLGYPGEKKPVSYFNHDGEYIYPVQLAESFGDYVESLLQIGLVGNEIWQLEKFIRPEPEEIDGKPCEPGAIDPTCDYALKWRKAIGLL